MSLFLLMILLQMIDFKGKKWFQGFSIIVLPL